MNKIKFLHLTIDTRYGGIYRFIENWSNIDEQKSERLVHFSFNYQALVISSIRKIKYNPSNIRENNGHLFVIDMVLNFYIYLKKSLESDFVVLHSIYLFPIAICLKIFKKNFIFVAHDFNNPFLIKLIINKIFKYNIVFVAPWLKDSFEKTSSSEISKLLKSKNIKNIILPVSKSNIFLNHKNKFEYKLFKNKTINLIFIGSLSPVKGLFEFLELIDYSFYEIKLHIIGKKVKRYMVRFPKFRSAINLFFYGEILDLKIKNKLIDKANFAIIPSKSEAFPFVYSEYLDHGIIPICSDLVVFKELTKLRSHIYELNDQKSLERVLNWGYSLDKNSYNKYLKNLKKDFSIFLESHKTIDNLSDFLLLGQ